MSGQWVGAWLVLCQRTLHYAIDNCPVKSLDLRKARCIVLQVFVENDNTPKTNDKGPNVLVDCLGGALYLRMWTARETKVFQCYKISKHHCRLLFYAKDGLVSFLQVADFTIQAVVYNVVSYITNR